jgi:hypothetical protein
VEITEDGVKLARKGQGRSTIGGPFGPDKQDRTIFLGCMAGKGYKAQ